MSAPNKFGSTRAKAQTVADMSAPNSELGADYIDDTSDHNGAWGSITALAAAVAHITAPNWAGTTTAVPIPAGTTIHGQFTKITLASGKVAAYRWPNP